ncbi:XRE family transcriptional regulator [Opitutaceae bacterium TAV4]|nr:XRE family transcriptional regulator [Opitutaceae bacterium TAV4]RRK01085.1 XRE family transcriptional regulator [Opitutaceae bacterium TAV3]
MRITRDATDDAILTELGARFTHARLERNLTQAQLAEQAGVAKRTVERLEAGAVGTQLSGIIRIGRVLGILERLDALIPEPTISPLEQLKLRGRRRQRATGTRTRNTNSYLNTPDFPPGTLNETPLRTWKWGDEK